MYILPQFSRVHSQAQKVASNMHKTAELMHGMYKLQRIINVKKLFRVIFAGNR